MSAIQGLEGLSVSDVREEISRGAKFVVFSYTISVLVMTFKRSSDIFFVRSGESPAVKGLPYTILSLLLGWWGIPWGFIYTPMSIIENLGGGKDVTTEVMNSMS
jgi:hypothetical protein